MAPEILLFYGPPVEEAENEVHCNWYQDLFENSTNVVIYIEKCRTQFMTAFRHVIENGDPIIQGTPMREQSRRPELRGHRQGSFQFFS